MESSKTELSTQLSTRCSQFDVCSSGARGLNGPMSIVSSSFQAPVTQIILKAVGDKNPTGHIDEAAAKQIVDEIRRLLPAHEQVQAWNQIDSFTHLSTSRLQTPDGRELWVEVLPIAQPTGKAFDIFRDASAAAAVAARKNNPGVEPDMLQGSFVVTPQRPAGACDVVGARIWKDGTVRVAHHGGRWVPSEAVPGHATDDPLRPVVISNGASPAAAAAATPPPTTAAASATTAVPATPRFTAADVVEAVQALLQPSRTMKLVDIVTTLATKFGHSAAVDAAKTMIGSRQLVQDGPRWRLAQPVKG